MFDKMKQLMDMKKQADKMKKELDATLVDCGDIQGVHIVINGSQNFQSISVDEDLIKSGDKGRLERAMLQAVNAAIKKSQAQAAQKMSSLMPGLT